MSSSRNPFEELEDLLERVSRQFEESPYMWEPESRLGRWTSQFEAMPVDLADHEDEFVVTVDLPGFERDNVDVRVTDHTLQIDADHEEAVDEEAEHYLRHERRHESMHRSIRLPDEVDKDSVNAQMKNGVLTITLPKIDVEEARSIDIHVE
ncbi:Hsp20/alpha crystallin family protein [Halobaculum limi]|uniref:Hsp20/alpha crystallin family protein n=1 Tax=Halobaculum limi TaxID=3031916 RepID=UPI002405167F|nr:Hsp20/alpha crystallin family protein [Halobaculum sp. YSMS11]